MAIESLNNPFAGYGSIVHGDHFIGRNDCLRQIQQRVLGTDYGNLAIVGLPRIGKSSLAWEGIMERKEELIAKRTIPVFLEVGSCESAKDFFLKLVELSFEELEMEFSETRIFSFATKCLESLRSNFSTDAVQKYFRYLKRDNIKSIFILDEFDRVRTFFDVAHFQLLRELSYNPQTKICLVPTARKTISDIEAKDGAISNLHGTFSTIRLTSFSEDDIAKYWKHYDDSFPTDDYYKFFISYLSGGHPWLMDKLNSQTFLLFQQAIVQTDLVEKLNFDMMSTLDSFIHTIEEEQLLNEAIQLVLGPLFKVGSKEEEALLKYGFIRKVSPQYKKKLFSNREVGPVWSEYAYVCYSDFSTLDLYRRYYANIPYVAEWSETENMLRSMIITVSEELYGDDWYTGMRTSLNQNRPWQTFNISAWDRNVSDLRSAKEDMINKFPSMAGGHDANFTLTAQIFDIFIRPLQEWYKAHIFKGNWFDWNEKFKFLTKVRNPVAHNNSGDIDEEMRLASQYCKEIKHAIREWQSNHQST